MRTRASVAVRLAGVVAAFALIVVVAGMWSHLTIHISVPANVNESGTINFASKGYSAAFRLAGLARGLAAALPLGAAAWWAFIALRRSQSRGGVQSVVAHLS